MATQMGHEPQMGPPTAEPTETRERSSKMVSAVIKAMITRVICQVAMPMILLLVMAETTMWTTFVICLLNTGTMSFISFVEEVPAYMPIGLQSGLVLAGDVHLYFFFRYTSRKKKKIT